MTKDFGEGKKDPGMLKTVAEALGVEDEERARLGFERLAAVERKRARAQRKRQASRRREHQAWAALYAETSTFVQEWRRSVTAVPRNPDADGYRRRRRAVVSRSGVAGGKASVVKRASRKAAQRKTRQDGS